MDSSDQVRSLSLTIEVLLIVFGVSLCVSLGMLIGPWLGFMLLSALCLASAIVLIASFKRSSRDDEGGPR